MPPARPPHEHAGAGSAFGTTAVPSRLPRLPPRLRHRPRRTAPAPTELLPPPRPCSDERAKPLRSHRELRPGHSLRRSLPPKPQAAPSRHRPRRPRANAVKPAPELNLGGTDSPSNVTASGPNVVPAKIDARWRNREPVYPRVAALRGEHGTVLLVVHVGADGLAAGVDVAKSSGFVLLDTAARDAVQTWRFLPALKDGDAVAFDVPLRVVFKLE